MRPDNIPLLTLIFAYLEKSNYRGRRHGSSNSGLLFLSKSALLNSRHAKSLALALPLLRALWSASAAVASGGGGVLCCCRRVFDWLFGYSPWKSHEFPTTASSAWFWITTRDRPQNNSHYRPHSTVVYCVGSIITIWGLNPVARHHTDGLIHEISSYKHHQYKHQVLT